MSAVETIKDMKESINIVRKDGASREVEFGLYVPKAQNVSLAGQFNGWNTNKNPMKKGKDGFWRVKVKLSSGTHEYKYFADGAWVQDVSGASTVPNSFGTRNCVVSC